MKIDGVTKQFKKIFWLLSIQMFGSFLAEGQNISSNLALTLPQSGQTSYSVNSGQTVNIVSAVSVVLTPGVLLTSGSVVTININTNILPVTPSNPSADLNRNWIYTRSYDENGIEISASKAFFDNNGKATQTQSKNESTGQVLATQTLYDLQGRGALSTLAAPINNLAFAYNANFVTNSSGAPYDYTNFDWNSASLYGKITNPDAVNSVTQGSLGWYYSNNNTLEPMVATTGFPYARSDFYHDGTGAAKRDAGIGESLRMGAGHETTSNSFPVQNELSYYLAIRSRFFPTAISGSAPKTFAGQTLQSISTDQNGTSVLTVTDLSGKQTLMTARADAGTANTSPWMICASNFNLSNVAPLYTLTVDIGDNNIDSLTINSPNVVTIDATTTGSPGCNNCQVYSDIGNNYVFASESASTLTITSAYPFTVAAFNSTTTPITAAYDQIEGIYTEPAGSSIQYFQLAVPSSVAITGGYTLYNMATEAQVTNFTSGSQLPAGYYKVTATAPTSSTPNNVTVSYSNSYSDISFNFYNQLGQLFATIAPNGVQQLIQTMQTGGTPTRLTYATVYEYDLQGRLIVTSSSEDGITNFIYRQDGKIRFSQNAYQVNGDNADGDNVEKFSYTNYDSFGRPVESGELEVETPTFSTLAANTALLENTDPRGSLPIGTKVSNINTYYDVPDLNLPASLITAGYVQDQGFLKGAASYTTSSTEGTINTETWYNYDDHGRISWLIRNILLLGNKTINYTYNAQGNVTLVNYQQGAADQFSHYYSYDADGRLTKVQTSSGGSTTMVQQANYYYYLHGPLKRMELGNQLQGVDYVYTSQGWLKAINTPTGNPADDPQQDGIANNFAKDAFGMQLEYFPNDYVRSNNVISVPTGTQYYYNGNVAGMSWQSNKPASVLSVQGNANVQNPVMYTYTYDAKYQYTGATWGTPSFTARPAFSPGTMFSEKGIGYDANGNINAMQHTNGSGTLQDDFAYTYTTNKNQLASVTNNVGNTTYGSYTYDEIGRLSSQANPSGTTYLDYDVTGKIMGIYNDAAFSSLKMGYGYDESGNRVFSVNETGTSPILTYYVYDATGNVMAIYTQSYPSAPAEAEIPIYGKGRLGTYFAPAANYVYEVRDNVGSVRLAINSTKVNSQADIYTYDDYYPFGSIAQSGGTGYRYDYQGAYSEKDAVTGYNNFDLRMYDSRIGRWLSTDPEGQYNSPYEAVGNNPVTEDDPTGGCGGTGEPPCVVPAGAPSNPTDQQIFGDYLYLDGRTTGDGANSKGWQLGAYSMLSTYSNNSASNSDDGTYSFVGHSYGVNLQSKFVDAGASVNFFTGQATWQTNFLKEGFDAGISGSVVQGKLNVKVKMGQADLVGDASGKLLAGDAHLTVSNPLIYDVKNKRQGFYADATAGVYGAEGDGSVTLNIGSMKIGASVSGDVISAHIGAGGGVFYNAHTKTIDMFVKENVGLGIGEGGKAYVSIPVSWVSYFLH